MDVTLENPGKRVPKVQVRKHESLRRKDRDRIFLMW